MSEVKRYRVLLVIDDNPLNSTWTQVVRASDFDAQRLRADTAEAELAEITAKYNIRIEGHAKALRDLEAAEQRNADISDSLKAAVGRSAKKWFYESFDDDLLELMQKHGLIAQAEGFSVSVIAELQLEVESVIDAALNQKSEGESQ